MTFKAIIFDLDGTLLDTLEDIADSMNHVLKSNGYPERPLENYRYYVGEGIQQLVYNALEDIPVDTAEAERLAGDMNRVYHQRYMDKTRPYEGVLQMLEDMSATGILLGVLSNKPDSFTKKMVSAYFSGIDFSIVLGTRSGIPKKPDPAAIHEMLGQWRITPSETVFAGDSKIDMQTAVNSGAYPAGVLWGFRTAEELLANGARTLISHPAELVTLLS